jgi:uncharacterized protein (UPF0335 family)
MKFTFMFAPVFTILLSCGITKVNSSNKKCNPLPIAENKTDKKEVQLLLDQSPSFVQFENLSFVGGIVSGKVIDAEDQSNNDYPKYSVAEAITYCSGIFRVSKHEKGYQVLVHSTDMCTDDVAVRGKEIQIQLFEKSDAKNDYGYETFNATAEIAQMSDEFYKGAVGVPSDLRDAYDNMLFTNPLSTLSPMYPSILGKTTFTPEEQLKFGKEYCQTYGDKTFEVYQKREKCLFGFTTRYYNFYISAESAKGKEKFLDSVIEKSNSAYKTAREKFSLYGNNAEIQAALAYEERFIFWEKNLRDSLMTKFLETAVNTKCAEKPSDELEKAICSLGKKKSVEVGKPLMNSEIKQAVENLISKNFDTASVNTIVALRTKYKDLRTSSTKNLLESIVKTHKLVAANVNSLSMGTNYAFKNASGKLLLYFDVKKIPSSPKNHLGTVHYVVKDGLLFEELGDDPADEYLTSFTSGKVLFLNGLPLWGTQTDEKQNGGASLLPLPERSGGSAGSQFPTKDNPQKNADGC